MLASGIERTRRFNSVTPQSVTPFARGASPQPGSAGFCDRGRAAAACLAHNQEVAGSNPAPDICFPRVKHVGPVRRAAMCIYSSLEVPRTETKRRCTVRISGFDSHTRGCAFSPPPRSLERVAWVFKLDRRRSDRVCASALRLRPGVIQDGGARQVHLKSMRLCALQRATAKPSIPETRRYGDDSRLKSGQPRFWRFIVRRAGAGSWPASGLYMT